MSVVRPSVVALVARREARERLRERSFRVGTLVQLAVLLAIVVLSGVVGGSSTSRYSVGLVAGDTAAAAVVDTAAARAQAGGGSVVLGERPLPDAEGARAAVRSGDVTAALVDGGVLVRDALPDDLARLLRDARTSLALAAAVRAQGGDPGAVQQQVAAAAEVPLTRLSPQRSDSDQRRAVAFVVSFLLYGQLVGYGLFVALGVVEEKSTRVVEVLLATVRPRELLAGKVLGLGALGLLQLLVVGGVALAVALVTGALAVPSGLVGVLAVTLLWFMLGYALFAAAFGAAASTVSRQEEVQNVTLPLTLLALGGFLIAVQAVGSPSSTLAVVGSLVPPLSALVMPARWAGGDAPLWQLGLSVALSLVATALVVALAGRLYATAVLRSGARVPLRAALRAALRASRRAP